MQSPRRSVSLLLALILLPGGAVLSGAAQPGSPRAPKSASRASISPHQQALHVLNRLAFGPRPGDVEAVEAMGVDRWINLQLHPGKIDDAALRQRLAPYRAAFLDPHTLMVDFPPNNLIRQAMQGRIRIPSAEPQHAIWENQIARLHERQQQKLNAAAPAQSMQSEIAPPPPPDAELDSAPDPSPASLLAMAPPQRYQALLALAPGSLQYLARSMPPRQRPDMLDGLTPPQRETILGLINPRLVVVNEAQDVRLLEDIYSQGQLQRVMTEFWLNHFNISAQKNEVEPWYLAAFADRTIAPHALGHFEDLLDAVAQSPAMLIYLDNQQSVGPHSLFALRRDGLIPARFGGFAGMQAPPRNRPDPGINENYGRELMELHTVGVNGGYTQQDVIEAAKVLTGWGVAPFEKGGGFDFNFNRHEPGPKVVMGHKISGGGQEEGFALLHILATSPSTAHFISTELAVRFVGDHPSPALVNSMAKTFLSTHGDIAKVLRTMIDSRAFWSASDDGSKIKTPLDYVVSAIRATNADVTQPFRLASALRIMGMPLTGTQQPNGYPMTNDAWVSSSELLDRMNFALALASNRIPGVTVSIADLSGEDNSSLTEPQQEAALEHAILHQPATGAVRQAIDASLADSALQTRAASGFTLVGDAGGDPFAAGPQRPDRQPSDAQAAIVAGLLIGSPQFQRR